MRKNNSVVGRIKVVHIPNDETKNINILGFNEAVKQRSDSAEYDREKWIYVPDFYSEYRYVLGTVGKKPLITIGINPSTAGPEKLDNTLKSVHRVAINNGYDSFIMFNIYAQRATNPDDMDQQFNKRLHQENLQAFQWVLRKSGEQPAIWAAWGTLVEKREYLKKCLEDMVKQGDKYNAKWFKAGKLTKAGHPHHPLYLKKDILIEEFDVKRYLQM